MSLRNFTPMPMVGQPPAQQGPQALNGGAVMSPEQLAKNKMIAAQLLKSGADVKGVDSGIEALGKVFESGVGVFMQNRNKQQTRNAALAGRLPGVGGLY